MKRVRLHYPFTFARNGAIGTVVCARPSLAQLPGGLGARIAEGAPEFAALAGDFFADRVTVAWDDEAMGESTEKREHLEEEDNQWPN